MKAKRILFDIVGPALITGWAATAIYNAAAGQSGLGALGALQEDVDTLSAEVSALRAKRLVMEQHADQLNSASLDPDLVDERIRGVLGFSRDGDIIISNHELKRAIAAQN